MFSKYPASTNLNPPWTHKSKTREKKIKLNTLPKKSRHRKEVLPIFFNNSTKQIICTENSTRILKP